jgi:16S rRNA (guanine527-N7)-methyltransferase
MEPARISALLELFLDAPLADTQLSNISIHIDMLVRWNSRVNLTAVRDPEQMVTRHFGESLFAARQVLGTSAPKQKCRLIDVGSGAGFPGLQCKIWNTSIELVLIESNQKKATFLREVVRALGMSGVEVFGGRSESYAGSLGQVVTLRAVERFEDALPAAAKLVESRGRLVLMISMAQSEIARKLLPAFAWQPPLRIPLSDHRIVLIGERSS